MKVYDVYDVRYGRVVDTVHAMTREAACKKASARTGIDITHLAANSL